MIIRRIGPVSFAKLAGALYAIIGFIIGGMLSLAALAGAFGGNSAPRPFPAVFGLAAVVILPVLYGCLAFVMTLISATLYNVLAGTLGGVELDIQ
jgi:hypothetical protein